jgi:hypothetical protein
MSCDNEAERENAKEHEVNAPNAPEGSTPEAEASPAVANFRQAFFTESRYGVLLALGEEPQEYQRENLAWRFSRQSEKVQSPENLAALMAPEDQSSVLLQRMEDSSLRRLWRLINAFGKVRQGYCKKRC